ncbi:MAG: hypothetical protein A3C07_01490 [Candidatus Sungbacteria bacterium RIFCSPHIGHO2_02_FULL_47_11]|uniref:Pseudouridine synthase n=1 Tax=Candidatus Sungbacteria bacterium RIFCSPHIGHO2_02_FULL_47_11 TaxID=1802270 RepID=A0A1G2KMK2_9BACT|nr:MAG: hypothetical protein A3C07_01490 [Candidatus Sungbacteria bacterium RIFCSPHIGHO2_02_FULL_47_11]
MEVIYSDKNLIVINKPPGISVHGGNGVRGETLVDLLLKQFPEIKNVGDEPAIRPGIVHRLDKDTSGVMVAARNQKSFEILKELFKTRKVEKIYCAIVCGLMRQKKGTIDFPIGRILKNPTKRGVAVARHGIKGAREARTDFRVIKTSKEYSFVELNPKTGRMHQLRVHLKAIGHPVACDRIYGGARVCCPSEAGRQLLHAQSLSFSFPEGKKLHFEADAPPDFRVALESIF